MENSKTRTALGDNLKKLVDEFVMYATHSVEQTYAIQSDKLHIEESRQLAYLRPENRPRQLAELAEFGRELQKPEADKKTQPPVLPVNSSQRSLETLQQKLLEQLKPLAPMLPSPTKGAKYEDSDSDSDTDWSDDSQDSDDNDDDDF